MVYWVMAGKTNPEIGLILSLSPGTVRTHLQNIFPKLGVETRLGATVAVWRAIAERNCPPPRPRA